jgi:hypothetical protein
VYPLRVQHEVGLSVEEEIPGLCNLPVLCILADLEIVEVRLVEPVACAHVVKVRGHEDGCVVHDVLLELGHHAGGKVVKAVRRGSGNGGRLEPEDEQDINSGKHFKIADLSSNDK